jgi:hypothetical protein
MSINDATCSCCDWYKPSYGCTRPEDPDPDRQPTDNACMYLSWDNDEF